MKYELDDPKITAYALGELDETEKEAMEAFLKENEAARDEVARIREAAQWLTAELGAEAPEGLSELEQARIMNQAKTAKSARRIHWGRWAVAASFVALAGGAWIGAMEGFKYGRKSAEADKDFTRVSVAKTVELPKLTQFPADGGSVSQNAPVLGDQSAAPPTTMAQGRKGYLGGYGTADRTTMMAQKLGTDANRPAREMASGGSMAKSVDSAEVSLEELSEFSAIRLKEAQNNLNSASQQQPVATPAPAPPAQTSNGWNTIGTKTMSAQAVIDLPDKTTQVSSSAPVPSADPVAVPTTPPAKSKDNEVRLNVQAPAVPESIATQMRSLGYGGVSANAPKAEEKKPDLAKGGIVAEQDGRLYMPRPMPVPPPPPPTPVPNSESYPVLPENTFQRTVDAPLSTFGLDVDTASYANVRRFLTQGTLPPGEAVRIEEMINYFKYDYPKPEGDAPFSVTVDAHPCPWAPTHTLARIGVRGKDLNTETRPAANLVFLIDVSGSMQDEDKLPLLKKGMKLLTQTVTANDRVSIVTYASGTGVALYPTSGDNKTTIENIIDTLSAGGSTNGAGGIQLAYDLARRAFIQGGVNRVILATDGDFNVGISDTSTLVSMIEQQAKTGVALSVLGFGQGNLKDERLMSLADKGNGNYAYIDSFQEARKALLEQATGTLFTIAKDVKIQVEFNPGKVGAYRLIGYEKRMLAAQDFNDDRKDAGEIGAGHTVTALYELVAPGEAIAAPQTDPLKYQTNTTPETAAPPATDSPELMTVKLRFKPPTGDVSTRFDVPIPATIVTAETRPDFQFASAVAAFGMLLRHSSYAGTATMDLVINMAQQGKGADENGLRAEFVNLARTASALMGTPQPVPMQQ